MNSACQHPLQETSSTWSHFVVKLRSRVRKTDVAPGSCYSKWRAEHCTLVQSVTEGHLGQFHLRPRVVQDLPAPLERAEDALLLQPGFGTHIEPRPQNTSQKLDLTHLKLESIVLLSTKKCFFFFRQKSITQILSITFFYSSNI